MGGLLTLLGEKNRLEVEFIRYIHQFDLFIAFIVLPLSLRKLEATDEMHRAEAVVALVSYTFYSIIYYNNYIKEQLINECIYLCLVHYLLQSSVASGNSKVQNVLMDTVEYDPSVFVRLLVRKKNNSTYYYNNMSRIISYKMYGFVNMQPTH